MSPASSSKLKDKSTSKPVKEPKAHSNDGFNVLLKEPECDPAFAYDSESNIEGPSECNELQKDGNNNSNINNASSRTSSVPGSDPTKQEKIKLKNEKKHQKRKEKRAQELEEKCYGYLTSRKLDSLAQQLVSMGFTSEAATTALIQNDGRLEASISWILDGGLERIEHINLGACNKKIDISDELSKIKTFESRFKCSKLDVEKAVVACEGDLQKAEEALKARFESNIPKAEEALKARFESNIPKAEEALKAQFEKSDEALKARFKKPETALKAQFESDLQKAEEASKAQFEKPKEASEAQFEKPEASAVSESLKEDRNEPALSAASEKRPPVSYTKPKSTMSTQVSRPVKKVLPVTSAFTIPTTAAFATTTQANQNAVPSPSEKRRPVSTTMGIPLQQTHSSASTSKYNADANTQALHFHDQYHHMPYVPSMEKPPKDVFGYKDNMHGTNTFRSSLPPSGSSVLTSKIDWGSHNSSMPFCDYTNIDWSLDREQVGLPPSRIKGERLYDSKALCAPPQSSSKPVFRKPGSDGGENQYLRNLPWAP